MGGERPPKGPHECGLAMGLLSFDEQKSLHFVTNSQINKEIWRQSSATSDTVKCCWPQPDLCTQYYSKCQIFNFPGPTK